MLKKLEIGKRHGKMLEGMAVLGKTYIKTLCSCCLTGESIGMTSPLRAPALFRIPVSPRKLGGFTLIELLVVITILAILAGAAIPYVQSYVQESRISKCKADLEEVGRSLAVYESREKAYAYADVSQLTGRYLNKAPIDPWGKAYIVATDSGVVFSCGPDRIPYNSDDLAYNYQPPLTLERVKWVDANQTGAVDTQNVQDYLQLYFSRIIATSSNINSLVPTTRAQGYLDFTITGTSTPRFAYDWAGIASLPDGRTFTLKIAPGVLGAFVTGSDSFIVNAGCSIWDTARVPNRCIASQDVIIQPQ